MQAKWILSVFTIALLTGCIDHTKYAPKTEEQIEQESQDRTASLMRKEGSTQSEIDAFIARSKLSDGEKLKSRISEWSTPAENLVSLIDGGVFYCDLQRKSLMLQISYEHSQRTRRKLVECISTTSKVINTYYYGSYVSAPSSDEVKSAADESYIKWNAYKTTIFQNSPSAIQEQASLTVKDQVTKSEQIFLREALKKNKK